MSRAHIDSPAHVARPSSLHVGTFRIERMAVTCALGSDTCTVRDGIERMQRPCTPLRVPMPSGALVTWREADGQAMRAMHALDVDPSGTPLDRVRVLFCATWTHACAATAQPATAQPAIRPTTAEPTTAEPNTTAPPLPPTATNHAATTHAATATDEDAPIYLGVARTRIDPAAVRDNLPSWTTKPPNASEERARIRSALPSRHIVMPGGRSVFARLLVQAIADMNAGLLPRGCWIGCVDSMLDATTVATAIEQGRMPTPSNPDGLLLGEACVLFRLLPGTDPNASPATKAAMARMHCIVGYHEARPPTNATRADASAADAPAARLASPQDTTLPDGLTSLVREAWATSRTMHASQRQATHRAHDATGSQTLRCPEPVSAGATPGCAQRAANEMSASPANAPPTIHWRGPSMGIGVEAAHMALLATRLGLPRDGAVARHHARSLGQTGTASMALDVWHVLSAPQRMDDTSPGRHLLFSWDHLLDGDPSGIGVVALHKDIPATPPTRHERQRG